MKKIHPSAIIEDGAQIGDDVEIGPFCFVGKKVSIGRGCRLHMNVQLTGNIEMGVENELFHSVSLGNIPQDISFDNPQAKMVIGDHNIFRENVTVHLPSEKGGLTRIGNHNFLMVNSHLGHDVKIGNHVIIVVGCGISGYVNIDDYAYVSGLVGVHQFCNIGSYSIVSGGCKVGQDVPPYTLISGSPAYVHGLNIVAFRRAGMSDEEKKAIRKIYRLAFHSGLPYEEALQKMESELLPQFEQTSPAYQKVKYFIDFSRKTKRGILSHISQVGEGNPQ